MHVRNCSTQVPGTQEPVQRLRGTAAMSPDLPAHNLPRSRQGTTATPRENQGVSPGAHKSACLLVHCGNSFSVCMYLYIPSDIFIIMR